MNVRVCKYEFACVCAKHVRRRSLCAYCACLYGKYFEALDVTATRCNTLQHTATRCNALQRAATHCNTLQHTATHCNTLRHTATHCNTLSTLQHAAAHYCTLYQIGKHFDALDVIFLYALQCGAVCSSVLNCVLVFQTVFLRVLPDT